jgi:D-arabinose 5-phosphate isomerase GutQ
VLAVDDQKLLDVARSVLEADARAVRATLKALDDSFLEAAKLVATAKGKVLVAGSGTSGNIAARGAHLLSVCGTPAFYLSPAEGLHGGLGALQADDLVIALSKGGSSDELNEFCRRAKTLCRAVIVITASPKSALAKIADHVIALSLDDDVDLGGVVATGSSLASGAVLDALCEMGRTARGYDWERLLFTHPSGAVGRDAAQSLERLGKSGTAD